jgi:hypothetical protein
MTECCPFHGSACVSASPVRGDEIGGREMDSTARDCVKDRRELAGGTGRLDATVGGMLGQVQHR